MAGMFACRSRSERSVLVPGFQVSPSTSRLVHVCRWQMHNWQLEEFHGSRLVNSTLGCSAKTFISPGKTSRSQPPSCLGRARLSEIRLLPSTGRSPRSEFIRQMERDISGKRERDFHILDDRQQTRETTTVTEIAIEVNGV